MTLVFSVLFSVHSIPFCIEKTTFRSVNLENKSSGLIVSVVIDNYGDGVVLVVDEEDS